MRLREAVRISSPALATSADRLLSGRITGAARRRRVALALTRYAVRAAGRPTPFGLLAGVCAARFGDTADVRVGENHRRAVQPDGAWLAALLSSLEQDPDILCHLRLVVNDQCRVRGNRLVLPTGRRTPADADADAGSEAGPLPGGPSGFREKSVRLTKAVEEVLRTAVTPVTGGALLDALVRSFGEQHRGAASTVICSLTAQEFLVSGLRPALLAPDPLSRLEEMLSATGDAAARQREDLERVRERLTSYRLGIPGSGGEGRLAALLTTLQAVQEAPARGRPPVQVDMFLDADITLPAEVGHEAAQALEVLWHVAARHPQAVGATYHAAFVERYGTQRLVPLEELLDPERGLGPPEHFAPAGHRPGSARTPAEGPEDRAGREMLLGELVQSAGVDPHQEVVLTDAQVERLASFGQGRPVPPAAPTAEMCARLLAASVPDLTAGRFLLVLSGTGGSAQAGAHFGRFAGQVPEFAAELGRMLPAGREDRGAVPAQLMYVPSDARLTNVCRVPQVLAHTVVTGSHTDPADPGVIRPDDLLIGADEHRMYAVSRRLEREVTVLVPHMLNPHGTAPHQARFLQELAFQGRRVHWAWSWGGLEVLPFLPRVRRHRTVLAPARWRPNAALCDASGPHRRWAATLDEWRATWHVPDHVVLVRGDHRLAVHLGDAWHRSLIRDELRKHPDTVIEEVPVVDGDLGSGWSAGFAAEVVIPLLPSPSPSPSPPTASPSPRAARYRPRTPVRPVRPVRPATAPRHLPGGEWLSAKLYASANRHDDILVDQLRSFVRMLPEAVDRWFFLRYADPAPHLRLRFHAPPAVLGTTMLPALHDWARRLRETGLLQDLTLCAYEPELERYGGTEAMASAEQVFHADSLAVLETLHARAADRWQVSGPELAAAGIMDLARQFAGVLGDGYALALAAGQGYQHTSARQRTRARSFLNPAGGQGDPDGRGPDGPTGRTSSDSLRLLLAPRRPAVSAYGRLLRCAGPQQGSSATILRSLGHMTANRLGLTPDEELAAHELIRATLLADRARHRDHRGRRARGSA
ncbi:lantibiotic dehydratase [Streptomyces telluris]|uniref:Lantibiotic dehydratase n=2 Tax=Streptomyces telluris TaxID=2720021 RepID=A0A9X2RPZ0_9ACTN|nr:lantibiotic dehydratase [Streptomyces telluris]MCQ8773609.1 lantibiotic dehydratase [Streptomyces telluris]